MAVAEAARLLELDANFVIDTLRGSAVHNAQLERWLTEGSRVHASAIAWSEFLCGPLDETDVRDARAFIR